ncbi:MAG: TetR family transcriptional regulator [Promethearchaeota archaeon]
MSQIEGKKKILSVAMDLIMKHGYSAISVRRIAREAKISIGTLYYHFPNGKVSILYNIMGNFGTQFMELIDFSDFDKLLKSPERIRKFLIESMKQFREISPLIKGFEVELLTNKKFLANSKEIIDKRDEASKDFISNFVETYIPNFIGKEHLLTIFGKILINIMYVQIILDNFYGTDDDLIEVILKIINGFFSSAV